MELLAIYDNNGNVTDKVITRGDKSVVLNDNEHVAVGVIFIENSENKFLIQKSSKEKGSNFTSTGGHINLGETPLESIKREVKEGLGLNVDNENIAELGFLLYDKPIRFMFYLKKDIDIDNLKLQKEEVDYVEFMTKEEILNLINEGKMLESHAKFFNEILKYKNNLPN